MRRVLLPHHISDQPAPRGGTIRQFAGLSMGTSWSVAVVEGGAAMHLQQGLQQQLDKVVAQMSHWEAGSDLGRFNRAPAGSWQALPAEFFTVLSFALDVAEASGGAYDPGAGALVNRWGFGPCGRYDEAGFVAPGAAEVAALLAAGQGRVELDPARRAARQPGAVQLDLSAVAKGYAVDALASYLTALGMRHFLVEVGGELRGAGSKPDGQPWWVALEQPAGSGAGAPDEMVLALHGLAVATSGDYRRYFRQGQQRYSHTLDPRSGVPVRHALASVTVVHAECMAADAWSTALGVLGPVDGLALAERLGLAARFLVRDGDQEADGALTEVLSSHLSHMLAA